MFYYINETGDNLITVGYEPATGGGTVTEVMSIENMATAEWTYFIVNIPAAADFRVVVTGELILPFDSTKTHRCVSHLYLPSIMSSIIFH